MTELRSSERREDTEGRPGDRQTVLDHLLAPLFGVRTEYRLAVSALETIIASLDVLLASLRPGEVARERPAPAEAAPGPPRVSLRTRAADTEQILRFLDRLHETEGVEQVVVSSIEAGQATVLVVLSREPEPGEDQNPTVVCAKCDKVISEGGPRISHGLCDDCAAELLRGFGGAPA